MRMASDLPSCRDMHPRFAAIDVSPHPIPTYQELTADVARLKQAIQVLADALQVMTAAERRSPGVGSCRIGGEGVQTPPESRGSADSPLVDTSLTQEELWAPTQEELWQDGPFSCIVLMHNARKTVFEVRLLHGQDILRRQTRYTYADSVRQAHDWQVQMVTARRAVTNPSTAY